jgi:hypothetical protein
VRIDGSTSDIFALLATRQAGRLRGSGTAVAISGGTAAESDVAASAQASNVDYDFTHMTPAEMQGVAETLWKAGEIDLTQLLMLQTAGMPLGRMSANGEFTPLTEAERASFASQPGNYFEIARNATNFIESTGRASDPTSGYDAWRGIAAGLARSTTGVDLTA